MFLRSFTFFVKGRDENRSTPTKAAIEDEHKIFLGPLFTLIQGTLEAQRMLFKKIQTVHCPTIKRGSIAWVGSGPEFFISLANNGEWKHSYTVFGLVLYHKI